MTESITKSSGNVFLDLGFSKEESTVMMMKAKLMAQSRVSDLVCGKQDKFSLDSLAMLKKRAEVKSGSKDEGRI